MALVENCPAETCEASFHSIVMSCAQSLDASLAVFLETDNPAGPHKARVALRRLTTAIDAFSPILRRKKAASLRSQAKAIFRNLGKVRDSDVHLMNADAGVAPKAAAALSERNRNLREKIRRKLRKQRMVGFTQHLRLAAHEEGMLFRRSPAALERRRAPVAVFAAEALTRAWKTCKAYGPSVKALPEFKQHDFRKDMKTLRYLAEFFADQLPTLQDTKFLKDFKKMQDALGAVNDFAVALQIDGRARPERLPPKVAAALDRAEQLWVALYEAPAPWGGQATLLP